MQVVLVVVKDGKKHLIDQLRRFAQIEKIKA